jgi:hypothetical protein
LKNPWRDCLGMPRHAVAVLAALRLTDPDFEILSSLSDAEWKAALAYSDRERITLLLRDAARENMPPWAQDRVDENAAKNLVRRRGIEQSCREVASWLDAENIEFVFLKGITHEGLFSGRAQSRVQYDLDLWLPYDQALAAQQVLRGRGYEPLPGTEGLPTDHLPALARKTGWQWRGDFFDAEIPLPVELHIQFWNEKLERFPIPGTDSFWRRRTRRPALEMDVPALHPADTVAYAAIHVLKHLLRGSVRVAHVFELAAMLHARATDEAFWSEWQALHPEELRRIEAIAFRLAQEWFGGRASPIVQQELAGLPREIGTWFDAFGHSPATQEFRPNKDRLWLHFCLLASRRDAMAIAGQRLFPRKLPAAAGDSFVPKGELSWRDWLRWRRYWLTHTVQRAGHHAAALPAALVSGAHWWWRTRIRPS